MVLIADHRSSRTGIIARIRAERGFRVLATLADLEVALGKVRETKPDLVLLSLGREGSESLTLAGALHGEAPRSGVIVVGLSKLQADVVSLVRAGVSGFVMVDASFDRLLHTIHSVARGISVLPNELTGSLFGQLAHSGVRRSAAQSPIHPVPAKPAVPNRLEVAVFSPGPSPRGSGPFPIAP